MNEFTSEFTGGSAAVAKWGIEIDDACAELLSVVTCCIAATASPPATRAPRKHLGRRAFAVSLAVIVGLTGFGYAALRANYDQNRRESINGVERTARLAGALGSSLIGVVQQELVVLSRSPVFLDGDVGAVQRLLDASQAPRLGFTAGLVWLDGVGRVQASVPSLLGDDPIDFASLDAVAAAYDDANAIEPVDIDSGPIRPIVFAVPTHGAPVDASLPAPVNGVLVGAVLLDAGSQDQLMTLFGSDAVLVVDAMGSPVFSSLEAEDRKLSVAAATLRRVPDDEADGVFDDVDGSVVGFARVPAADWLIIVETPRDELFGPARWQFERSLIALGLLFVASVGGAGFAAWRLDRVHQLEAESRRLFQTVIEQLPVGVAALDRQGRLVITNDRADAALGVRPGGETTPPALGAALDAMHAVAVTRDENVTVPGEGGAADRTLVVRAAPVVADGQVTGAAAIVEDVTRQRRLARRAALIASATADLAAAASRQEVAAIVARGVEAFGAQNAIVVLRDQMRPDELRLMSTRGLDESDTAGWEVMSVHADTPVAEAARTGTEVFVTKDDATARFPDMGDLFERSGNAAWAALPLRSAGRVDGALGLSFRSEDDVDLRSRSQLVGFAAQVSQALDRATRQSIEHDVALVLQRGLLQPAHGEPDRIEVATRYVPAEDHLEVGGDFFDILALQDGAVMLVIGDVVGHGLDAASAMGQLRSAARALSSTTCSPARVLELLDGFAELVPACRFATAAIVVIDADRRSLRYSVAGHPPPAWAGPSGDSGLLDGARSRPLGVYATTRPEATVELESGVTVCLYTDGLIEKRGEIIDVGLDLLRSTLVEHRGLGCVELADRLVADVGGGGRQRDDIAVVCARFSA